MIVKNEINLHGGGGGGGGDSQIKLINARSLISIVKRDFSTKQIMVTDYSMPESGCEK